MSVQSDILSSRPALNSVLWRHRVLLSIVLIHLAFGLSVSLVLGTPFESGTFRAMRRQLTQLLPLFLIGAIFGRFLWMAVRVRPEKPIHWFLADMRGILFSKDRMANAVTTFLAVAVFTGTFAFIKEMIPHMVPFSWDPAIAEMDRWLHGGQDPWRLLLPVFGSPSATTLLNAAYHLWFLLMYSCVFWAFADTRNMEKSVTFLIAYVLTWAICGNLMATLFSSVGPDYYQAMGFGDTFVPLTERLYALNEVSPVWALEVQELLLDGYLNDGPIKAISAMPSMHVASTVIITLFCFSHKRWLGWVMAGFTVAIMIGSVHLGWHYAIDGYFSVALALAIWALSRALVRRFPPDA